MAKMRAQDVGHEMGDPVLIAPVWNYLGEPLGDAEPTLRLGEQHDAAIRRDRSAIKGGSDLLALNGWKGERQQIIVGLAGVARSDPGPRLTSTTKSYARSKAYATSATPNPPCHE
jgi:hypothetical protein